MGSKSFKSILKGLTNGATETASPTPTPTRKGWAVERLTPEQRQAYRNLAHKALREGLTVFVSKETAAQFSRILNTDVNSRVMRRLLEEIGNGKLVLTGAGKPAMAPKPPTTKALPTVLSIDQLSGGLPFNLKQAAKILNVSPQKLYFRCITGRLHFERVRSRYYIPATEVARLQVIGL